MADDAGLDPELISELGQVATTVAVEAGRLIVQERPDRLGVAATKSNEVDVVTVMDRRSEALLRDRLGRLRPADGLLGEEGASRPAESGITWVVDPIDGTVNYLYEIPAYAVSVAACVGDVAVPGAWRPVAGAVVNPMTQEVFRAELGNGSYLEHGDTVTRLSVSHPRDLAVSLIGTGFGYDPLKRRRQGEVLGGLIEQIRDIRRAGSAALDLCAVGAGRLDGYFESGLNPWDLAAGWLIATEAGATVIGAGGQSPDARLTLAGAPATVAALAPFVDR